MDVSMMLYIYSLWMRSERQKKKNCCAPRRTHSVKGMKRKEASAPIAANIFSNFGNRFLVASLFFRLHAHIVFEIVCSFVKIFIIFFISAITYLCCSVNWAANYYWEWVINMHSDHGVQFLFFFFVQHIKACETTHRTYRRCASWGLSSHHFT